MEEEIGLNDIIRVLWKRKWVWILLPLMAGLVALVGSQMMTPTYASQATLALGNFNDNVYTSQSSAKEVLLSAETLEPAIEALHLEYETVSDFRESLQVEPIVDTPMLNISARHHDPATARAIVDAIVASFIEQSSQVYEEKRALLEEQLASLQTQYDETGESLARNKAALTALETNTELSNAEKDLSRARLLDYVVKDEDLLINLTPQMQAVQQQLLEMDDAQVIAAARDPREPVGTSSLLLTALAMLLGGVIGVVVAFMMEYFQHNPVRLRESESRRKA